MNNCRTPSVELISRLIILNEITKICPVADNTVKIYKYLHCKTALQNMMQGNLWFTGPNYNRVHMYDGTEYNTTTSTRSNVFSLSCSLHSPYTLNCFRDFEHCIEISNIDEFLEAINVDLQLSQLNHSIYWLNKKQLLNELSKLERKGSPKCSDYASEGVYNEELKVYQSLLAKLRLIKQIKFDPEKNAENLQSSIFQLSAQKPYYYDPNDEVHPHSQEALVRSFCGIRKRFDHENEYRIVLDVGDFLTMADKKPEPHSLHHLVAHLQLRCPSIRDFMSIVNVSEVMLKNSKSAA